MSNYDKNINPKHYKSDCSELQVIDVIKEFGFIDDYLIGNVLKYTLRSKKKGEQLEDLEKAKWYLKYKIKELKELDKKEFYKSLP